MRKWTFCTASLVQISLGLRDLFAPAILAALILTLAPFVLDAAMPVLSLLAKTFFAASILDVVAAMIISKTSSTRSTRPIHFIQSVAGYSSAVAYIALIACLPVSAVLVLLAPAITLVPMMILLPRAAYPILLRMQFSPLTGWAMLSSTCVYALFNLCDVSWGTKGLLRAQVDAKLVRGLRFARSLVFTAWVIANGGIVAIAVMMRSVERPALNVVVEAIAAVDVLLAAGGIFGILKAAWHRRMSQGRVSTKRTDAHQSSVESVNVAR